MARAGLDWSTTDLAHARCGGFEDAQGCVPGQRRQAGWSDHVGDQDRGELGISPETNYNPGYARNKRIQASVYFSWPPAAKW